VSNQRYEFGVITDEIDQDLERACAVATDEGMSYVELNQLWGKDAHDLTDEEIDRVQAILEKYNLRTHLVCGLFFRPFSLADVELATMEDHPRFHEHMARLERFIKIAKQLKAQYIRTFGFTRDVGGENPSPRSADGGGIPEEHFPKIVKGLQIACDRLAAEGLTLALENARSLYLNTGGNMRRALDAVQRPNLKIIWDAANAFVAGENPVDGFHQVRGHIVDVHCKDAIVADEATGLTKWVRIGDGSTDWLTQLRLLRDEPVREYTIETHWRPPGSERADNTRATFAGLKELIAKL
jgi:sugar phosphate isomerase/epimerase